MHHKDLLTNDSYILQNFVQGLIRQVESLRSTVSKNALLAFKDLSNTLKKNLDSELDHILSATMKKATDTNIFLSKAAEDVLVTISQNSNESKIINAISSLSMSRAPSAKVKIQTCLETLIKRLGNKLVVFKENIAIMSYLSSYISDASEKVRNKAKSLLETLKSTLSAKNLEKLIRNTCNQQQHKSIFGYYNLGHRSSMSEDGSSRPYFNRSKVARSNLASSSRYQQSIRMPELINNYCNYEIPDKPRTKRVQSVIKTHPKSSKLP